MPYIEKEPEKMFYPIGEVAKMFDVSVSQIRYWSMQFAILEPKKNKKGNRMFSPADVEVYKIIFDLVKVQGLTIEGANKYLKENKKVVKHEIKTEKNNYAEIEIRLKKIRNELIELKESI